MKALVLLGSAQEDKATREAYWGQVLKTTTKLIFDTFIKVLTPLEARYQEIVGRDNLKAIYMDAKVLLITFHERESPSITPSYPKVRGAVVDVLESLTGVVQGCAVSTVHQVHIKTSIQR